MATCNKQAKGAYKINLERLPTDANAQRELLVRRLAAEDSSIDLMGMDVIWTAEFAQAKWIKEWTGADKAAATKGKLKGPLRSVQYQDKTWAMPFTSNTQLLWYRKDKVKTPPKTWDEMIDQAIKLNTAIEVQGRQYEGLTVWVNSLIASAGGQIVDENGKVKVDATAKQAAEIMKRLASSKAAPPGPVHQRRGPGPAGLRVRALGLPDQLPVHLPQRGRGQGPQGLPEEDRLGALPGGEGGQAEPAAAGRHQPGRERVLEEPGPGLPRRALPGPAREPDRGHREGRAAPHHRVALRRPEGQEGLPVR